MSVCAVWVLTAVLKEDKVKIVREKSCETSTKGQMEDMTHEEKLFTMATTSLPIILIIKSLKLLFS